MTSRIPRRGAWSAALIAGALGLAACGGSSSGTTATADGPAAAAPLTPAEAGGVSVAELDFVADTLDGGQLDATTLAGTDTIVWFWAPW